MSVKLIVGDVLEVLAGLEDGTVDLVLTSPPFLGLRSYLPADHPDKSKEIGSEANPAAFLDVLLDLTEEWGRVLAPHGSICVELGDTYAGSGGAGGDYGEGGLREGQEKFVGSGASRRGVGRVTLADGRSIQPNGITNGNDRKGNGWPLDKSLTCIPGLYAASLAYGRNLLNPARTIESWRVRNLVAWVRCLDGDTVVYARTPKGVGPARLLHLTQNWQPGQWELWDGEHWTQVVDWSTTEATDGIEIEFRNGERISATPNHQWPTNRGLVRTDSLRVGDTVQTTTLPDPDRPEPEHLPDADIGWLVGCFLADGSFDSRDRIQISSHHDEVGERLDRLRALADAYDGTATAHYHEGLGATVVLRSYILAATLRRYVGGDGARNKHLLPAAWRRRNAFLNSVLDGYLAGDGHWDVKNDRWRLGFTDNGWLARDLRVICARLGYRCRLKRMPRKSDPRGGNFAGTASFWWRGEIRMTMNRDLAPIGQVVALRPSKRRRFFDVGVADAPHLFALGSGLLTHNSNPPVGALGDKVRPATSYLTWACHAKDRWFDLDAVRTDGVTPSGHPRGPKTGGTLDDHRDTLGLYVANPAGAPPLDWWKISPKGYEGAHYATWAPEVCRIPIEASCPRRVCRTCGQPSRRIVSQPEYVQSRNGGTPAVLNQREGRQLDPKVRQWATPGMGDNGVTRVVTTTGWTSCGCPGTDGLRLDGWHTGEGWRPGVVLDPFAGSGTTLMVAHGLSRDAVGIDLDARNADLARDRLGMFLEVSEQQSPPEGVGA